MPASSIGADAKPPSAYVFVTVTRGRNSRTIRLRKGVIGTGYALLALLTFWTIGSSLYLACHDDLVAALMKRQASAQLAYEDRIAALRQQVDREASRQLVGGNTLDMKVHELALRAASLETRASLVAQLADRAGFAGPDDSRSATARQTDVTGRIPLAAPPTRAAPMPLAQDKPHPETDTGPLSDTRFDPVGKNGDSLQNRLASVTVTLEHIDAAQYGTVAALDAGARRKTDALRSIVLDAGLSPERLRASVSKADMGGPFVPLGDDLGASPFGRALAMLQADVAATEHWRRVVPLIPFASPLVGDVSVTSPFGPRMDPFLGKAAMHTGVDLREDFGTDVYATAPGRVSNAGPSGGYGNMVEIDHGNGLSTRYAHLEQILVSPGETVERGSMVGRVGATGRATGPHLHYETRIDGEAVDPMRFLDAGRHLAALDPSFDRMP